MDNGTVQRARPPAAPHFRKSQPRIPSGRNTKKIAMVLNLHWPGMDACRYLTCWYSNLQGYSIGWNL